MNRTLQCTCASVEHQLFRIKVNSYQQKPTHDQFERIHKLWNLPLHEMYLCIFA